MLRCYFVFSDLFDSVLAVVFYYAVFFGFDYFVFFFVFVFFFFFFFQAEDGIRDWSVTGVQTCALPIYDVICDDWDNPLLGFADIIKVDFRGSDARTKASLPGLIAARKIKALAEKIETRAEFDEAVGLGYTYLQGYFFSKPLVLSGRDVPGVKHRYLELLREINRTDLDFGDLEGVIKREPSLTYKLMDVHQLGGVQLSQPDHVGAAVAGSHGRGDRK